MVHRVPADMCVRGPLTGRSAVNAMAQLKTFGRHVLVVSLTLILLLDVSFTSARPHHSSRHHFKGHKHRHKHRNFKMPAISGNGLPIPISYHLVFSETKPTLPPWEILQNKSSTVSRRDGSSRKHHRTKRSQPLQSVCDDVGEWVALTHSKDIYDYDVEVLQGISVGGVRMDQYFYETRCIHEQVACAGIDTKRFESQCHNKYIWTYGYVRNNSSEEGWRQIRIKGSCNCAIRERTIDGPSVSLLEFV